MGWVYTMDCRPDGVFNERAPSATALVSDSWSARGPQWSEPLFMCAGYSCTVHNNRLIGTKTTHKHTHELLERFRSESWAPLVFGRWSFNERLRRLQHCTLHSGSSFCSALPLHVVTAWLLTVMCSSVDGSPHIEAKLTSALPPTSDGIPALNPVVIVTVVNSGVRATSLARHHRHRHSGSLQKASVEWTYNQSWIICQIRATNRFSRFKTPDKKVNTSVFRCSGTADCSRLKSPLSRRRRSPLSRPNSCNCQLVLPHSHNTDF